MRRAFFTVGRALGLFALARMLTKRSLRILCYHGFSFDDEHHFRPKLFMKPAQFEQRLRYLRDSGYHVIPLEDAVRQLRDGNLKANSVVITIDDGFFGVHALAMPLLRKYGFPGCLYLTTYYAKHQFPVFRLAVQYVLWKTKSQTIDASHPELERCLGSGPAAIDEHTAEKIIEYGERDLDEDGRQALLRELAKRLDVDLGTIRDRRLLSLVSAKEVDDLLANGIDVQLHTHRHRMPREAARLEEEMAKNREVLAAITSEQRRHFCYPSGIWNEEYWPVLERLGIRSATTCMPGLNGERTPLLALRRQLDAQNVTQLEFEAEISGFKELLRTAGGLTA